jgi:hypothetical protein
MPLAVHQRFDQIDALGDLLCGPTDGVNHAVRSTTRSPRILT